MDFILDTDSMIWASAKQKAYVQYMQVNKDHYYNSDSHYYHY